MATSRGEAESETVGESAELRRPAPARPIRRGVMECSKDLTSVLMSAAAKESLANDGGAAGEPHAARGAVRNASHKPPRDHLLCSGAPPVVFFLSLRADR